VNKELALKASKNGAIAALISGVVTLAIFVYALSANAEGTLGLWNDPALVVDIVIIFACAFGMFRQSRAAAITMTVYWVISKAYIFLETGALTGPLMSVIFLYFFAKAIQGTFAYHKIRKVEDPSYRAAPRWYYFVGVPTIALLFLIVALGLLTMTDYVPSTNVLSGSDVSIKDKDALIASGVLYMDDEIELFYSYGFLSVLEGGNILTDRAVITYFVDENDELAIYEFEFDQIESVELYEEGNYLTDSIYKINSFGEDNWFTVELSTEEGGDVRFVEALRNKVRVTRGEAEMR